MTKHPHHTNDTSIIFPFVSVSCDREQLAIYNLFMQQVRGDASSQNAETLLSAIYTTAQTLNYNEAHVAKVLVDFGLRAPRGAFPVGFLRFADRSLGCSFWSVESPSRSLLALKKHWEDTGRRFVPYVGHHHAVGGHTGYAGAA